MMRKDNQRLPSFFKVFTLDFDTLLLAQLWFFEARNLQKIKYVIICKRNFNLNNMPGTHL